MRHLALPRIRQRWLVILGVIAFAWVSHLGWKELTNPWGAQKVSFTKADEDCGASGPLRYCVYLAANGVNGDVLYHLHGRGLDERVWNDDTYLTAMLQAQWEATGVTPPTVVTLSYGPTWLLTPTGERENSGLLPDLMGRLPEIESHIGTPRRRMLAGESMGGLNVLIAGLSNPQAFDRIAALCPGVYAVSPFASLSASRAATKRTGANPKMAFGVWLLARKYLANEEEWRRVSPLALIERADSASPALYLSNGLYDAYGNYEGTRLLAERATRRGVRTEWHPLYGGHCATDIKSLAAFLTS